MIKRYFALLSLCTVIVFVQCARQHRGIPRGDGYRGVGRVETTVITKNDAVIIRQEQPFVETTVDSSPQPELAAERPEIIVEAPEKSVDFSKKENSILPVQEIDSTENDIVVNEEDIVKGHKNVKRSRGFLTVGTIGLVGLFLGFFIALLSFSLGGLVLGAFLSFLGLILWIIGLIGGWITLSRFKRIEFVDEADFKRNKRQKVWGLILMAPILIYALLILIFAFA
jgi:hypothetical protein